MSSATNDNFATSFSIFKPLILFFWLIILSIEQLSFLWEKLEPWNSLLNWEKIIYRKTTLHILLFRLRCNCKYDVSRLPSPNLLHKELPRISLCLNIPHLRCFDRTYNKVCLPETAELFPYHFRQTFKGSFHRTLDRSLPPKVYYIKSFGSGKQESHIYR